MLPTRILTAALLLTCFAAAPALADDMKKDGMAKGEMSKTDCKDAMQKDGMSKGAMAGTDCKDGMKDGMSKDGMSQDNMMAPPK